MRPPSASVSKRASVEVGAYEGGDWKGRIKAAKRPLVSGLGYNAINSWSVEARYFAEQAQLVTTHKELGCRILYLLLSFIAVAFDFVMKDLAFSEPASKLAMLNDGLRYGSRGPKDMENIPTRILAEHFGKPSVSQELFTVAKELEAAAYSTKFVAPESLSAGAKGMLGVFLDFWEMPRARFFDGFDSVMTKAQSPATNPSAASSTTPGNDTNAQVPLPGMKPN